MGISPKAGAVVDSRARVFGTKRLRVVDASVLPFLPPGHPQATICEPQLLLLKMLHEPSLTRDRRTGRENSGRRDKISAVMGTGKIGFLIKFNNLSKLLQLGFNDSHSAPRGLLPGSDF
jgi:hypothetical protein